MYDYEKLEIKNTRPSIPAWLPKLNSKLWDQMDFYLTHRELSCPTAKFNSWYPSTNAGDDYQRIVMPATNSKGWAYWQARLMETATPEIKRYQSPAVPREDSVIIVWPEKSDHMPVLVLTEGPMDALAAATCGVPGIAVMGLHPSDMAIQFIKTKLANYVQHITFFADRDALPEAVQLSRRMAQQGLVISVSTPTPYKDLAAMPLQKRTDVLNKYLALTAK